MKKKIRSAPRFKERAGRAWVLAHARYHGLSFLILPKANRVEIEFDPGGQAR